MAKTPTVEQTSEPRGGYKVFRVVRTIFIYLLAAAIIIAVLYGRKKGK